MVICCVVCVPLQVEAKASYKNFFNRIVKQYSYCHHARVGLNTYSSIQFSIVRIPNPIEGNVVVIHFFEVSNNIAADNIAADNIVAIIRTH